MTDEQQRRDSSQTQPTPAGPHGHDLYAVDQYDRLNVANGVLLLGKTTGARLTVMQEVELVLQHCTLFRTLPEHARHLVDVFPQLGGNVDDAMRVLDMVRSGGLLLSAGDICRQVNAPTPAAPSLDRTTTFIITCDRPAAIERLLDSVLRSARLSRQQALWIVDDSRDPENATANSELVAKFNLSSPLTARYLGPAQQDQLLADLVAAMPGAEGGIRFLLERERWSRFKTYGRARTLCLLASVGERCIIMDDDVICAALGSPHQTPGFNFSNGGIQADFYASADAWHERTRLLEFDPMAGHGRLLGMNLSQALRELGRSGDGAAALRPEDLRGVSAALFQHYRADTPILVTQSGTLGDPGTGSNAWLVQLERPSINRMLAAPGGLATALATRQCWLGQDSPTFSKLAVMSQVTGLDNRHSLPPYFPILRGEDQLFGIMLDFLHPNSTVLEYDWAVPHLPLETRSGNPQGDSCVPRGGLQLLGAFLSELRPADPAVSFETRLELLAARLQELSEYATEVLTARFRVGLAKSQALSLQTLGDRIADSGKLDGAWEQLLQRHHQDAVTALQEQPELADLPGLPAAITNEQVAQYIRDFASGYAAALRAWPGMRELAPGLLAAPPH